jgi:hypothetical protein
MLVYGRSPFSIIIALQPLHGLAGIYHLEREASFSRRLSLTANPFETGRRKKGFHPYAGQDIQRHTA